MTTIVNPFDRGAAEAAAYDAWYDSEAGRAVLALELECVGDLLDGGPRPWLDLGAGSGRFGGSLGAEVGLDAALELIRIAAPRMPSVVLGRGEALPFRNGSVGAVLSVAVFEFLEDPQRVMREVARVLCPGGRFVLGFFPRGSKWALAYERQGRDPASVFHGARFLSLDEVRTTAGLAGLSLDRMRLTLFEAPGVQPSGRVSSEWHHGAGFAAVELLKSEEQERQGR